MSSLPSRTSQQYTLYMDSIMDQDIERLEQRLGKDRSEVFLSALRLYAIVKEHELGHQSKLILEEPNGKKTEIINV